MTGKDTSPGGAGPTKVSRADARRAKESVGQARRAGSATASATKAALLEGIANVSQAVVDLQARSTRDILELRALLRDLDQRVAQLEREHSDGASQPVRPAKSPRVARGSRAGATPEDQ